MTIGQLSQRTGVPIKILRDYEERGFLYTQGRSESNYRLFGDEALWCVQVIQGLRSLGLTLNEIQVLTTRYRQHPDESVDVLLDATVAQARARVEARLVTLQALRLRILEFQAARANPSTRRSDLSAAVELLQLLNSDPLRSTAPSAS